MRFLGARAKGPGRVYLVGGATAVLMGWRDTTIDIDLKLDPEPEGVFEAIRDAKRALHLNVELAAPDDFLPPVPGWRDRSPFVARHGPVDFFHYDLVAQCLGKLVRGFDRDLLDARALFQRGLVTPSDLRSAWAGIEPSLVRYPSVDARDCAARIEVTLVALEAGDD